LACPHAVSGARRERERERERKTKVCLAAIALSVPIDNCKSCAFEPGRVWAKQRRQRRRSEQVGLGKWRFIVEGVKAERK
jgi:hypothetical protein